MKAGKPTYTYNWLGLQRYTIAAKQALPAGKANIRFEFAYDGGGVGKGGTGTLFVNGKNVATGRIDQTQCCAFSADEGADVGADEGTPVTEAYQPVVNRPKPIICCLPGWCWLCNLKSARARYVFAVAIQIQTPPSRDPAHCEQRRLR
jgi:hypothetical protein